MSTIKSPELVAMLRNQSFVVEKKTSGWKNLLLFFGFCLGFYATMILFFSL